MIAISQTGSLITGTIETIAGEATISQDSFKRDAEGHIDFDYVGETEIWWDEQKTQVNKAGERLFNDEDGKEWTESQIKLIDDGDLEVIRGRHGWRFVTGKDHRKVSEVVFTYEAEAERAGRLHIAETSS